VRGDPTQLHQVLLNLCINARDAMPDGGRLRISAVNDSSDESPHVVVDVEDTGAGIPQNVIDRIFDPFFTTKPIGKGTGLGLSTVLTIVKRHGGSVQVTSEPGTGTRFRILLPAQQGVAAGEDAAPPDWPRGHGETVLVVDDEVAVREITRLTLEAFGYHVMLASHGAEAVSLYAEHAGTIAMVITDLMMPVMGGVGVIQALREMHPGVAVLAVSGSGAVTGVAPSGTATDIPVLAKPFSREALLRAVRDGLDQTSPKRRTSTSRM
jgi:CheY-like chemotaxis protein